MASKFPCCTVIFEMSPRGSMNVLCVTEDAKNPIVEQTGASSPMELGSSFNSVSNANLCWSQVEVPRRKQIITHL